MANWCYNSITITGDLTNVRPLIQQAITCNKEKHEGWLPESVERDVKGLLNLRYLFSVEVYEDTEKCIGLQCETRWAPPIEEVVAIQKLCPGSRWIIDYEESGCNIYGRAYINDDGLVNYELDENQLARVTYDDETGEYTFDGEKIETITEVTSEMLDEMDQMSEHWNDQHQQK